MSKAFLGKSATKILHYSVAADEFDEIEWLTYERPEDLLDGISAFLKTALTYAIVASNDFAIDLAGNLWQFDDQDITTPAGSPTLRNIRVLKIPHSAKAVTGATGGFVLKQDDCFLLLEDDCKILREEQGFRVVAVSANGISAGDTISASARDSDTDRSIEYVVSSVTESMAYGNFTAYRLSAEAA